MQNISKKFFETVTTGAVADRVGMYSLKGDHPGIDPKLDKHKKKKTSKVDRSIFSPDKEARTKYIQGTLDASGYPKNYKGPSKIKERIEERLRNLDA